MIIPFFGLSPEYQLEIFKQIFNMVTFGKGGWDFATLYNLPVHIRTFYFHELSAVLKKEAEAARGPLDK